MWVLLQLAVLGADIARAFSQPLPHALLQHRRAAQQQLQDALEQQRGACLARDREAAARQAAASEHAAALDAARRGEAGARERLGLAERQLAHQGGEVAALRQANEQLELAVAALRVGGGRQPQQARSEDLALGMGLFCTASDGVGSLRNQASTAGPLPVRRKTWRPARRSRRRWSSCAASWRGRRPTPTAWRRSCSS